MQKLRVALCQLDFTVGDITGNSEKIMSSIEQCKKDKCDFVVFPELAVTGYPPEDLLLRAGFIEENMRAIKRIKNCVGDTVVVIGFVHRGDRKLYNSAAIIYRREIVGIYDKMQLPNYGVFDEQRYFEKGQRACVFEIKGIKFGINICEDIWHWEGPVSQQVKKGARYIFTLNASPYHFRKIKEREKIIKNICRKNHVCLFYVNLVGGQDEIVFDGQSLMVDEEGEIIRRGKLFEEQIIICQGKKESSEPVGECEELYKALVTGLRDYVHKNGFKKVVIGLSGGIDSSLTATIAVDALGKENVTGVFMPSRFSSKQSRNDAKKLSENLKIKFLEIPIENIFCSYLVTLKDLCCNKSFGITEENIQARIRGNLLMALSNEFGYLVLTTGNKSETSVGYTTLYGDMAGGFAPLKDLYKTMVYRIAEWRNSMDPVIPASVLTKEPTAELRENQKDRDTLPSYKLLDEILKEYIEKDKTYEELVQMGYERTTVKKVIRMVDKNEYKRRQSPPGVKITPKAFGKDRRMPITNHYTI